MRHEETGATSDTRNTLASGAQGAAQVSLPGFSADQIIDLT